MPCLCDSLVHRMLLVYCIHVSLRQSVVQQPVSVHCTYECLCDSLLFSMLLVFTVHTSCLCDSLLFSNLSGFTVHTSVFVTVCCSVCCWCTIYMSCDSVLQQVVSVYYIHVSCSTASCVYCIHVSCSTASC